MAKKSTQPALSPRPDSPEEAVRLWAGEDEPLRTIVKNVYSSMVIVPHGLNKEIEPIVLQPGEEQFLENVEEWRKSYSFRAMVEGTASDPPRLKVFLARAPRVRPMPPLALTQNLTPAQLHTVDQILMLPFEKALEIINVQPRGDSDVDAETGISQAGMQWLARTHLRVLRCARWIEEHSDRRPALLAALDCRIKEIHELVAPRSR